MAIIAAGPEACRALEAADYIEESTGISPSVYDIRYIKPIDVDILEEAAAEGCVLTVEEGCIKGGLFGAVAEYMASQGHQIVLDGLGIPDVYLSQDKQTSQRAECGLDKAGIAEKALFLLKNRKKV